MIAVRSDGGRAFDTDIQNLLPQTALEPVVRAAIADAGQVASSRVAVLISGEDYERVEAARADLEHALTETGFFVADSVGGEAFGRWLFANRNALMCARTPAAFDANAVVARSNALLYSPLTPVSGEMLSRDPFLLTLQLADCLSPAAAPPGDAVLVSGKLNASAFRLDAQDAVTSAYEAWRARFPDVEAARAGAVFHAEAGARQARVEISWIASISTIAVLVLLLICFKRPEAIAGTLAVTAAGGVGSLAATMLVFPTVHVLVFVFGSALIGITSDYALHYLATGPQTGWAPPAERVKRVARPLAVCALATALGFGSLGLFGVTVFTQVAVFSVAGVLTAWWFTVTILPFMDLKARKPGALTAWWNKLEAPFLKFKWTGLRAIVGAVLVFGVVGVGIARFRVLDDVRQFQPRSAELTAEETTVRNALGFSPSPTFLLSYANSPDAARRNEETVLAAWPEDAVRDTLALSRFDPSTARRAENGATLERALYAPHLAARVEQLGLTSVDVHAATQASLPPELAALQGEANGVSYLVAPLGPRAAQEHVTAEGARLVDPAARYTEAFRSFRLTAVGAVGAAFVVCGLIVLALYRRWRALTVLAAPAFGVIVGIALPTALGMPVSFFTVAALFVVIGTGIDHSVFTFDAAETDGQAKELVVFLAALTTILSMGLLALSGTYPVASLGAVVAAGVTAAYLVSFVPSGGRKHSADGQD